MYNLYKYSIVFFLFTTYPLLAQNSYDNLAQSIDSQLKNYKEVATDTKKNEHYQPYIVSILENETLVKLGFVTLEDALKIIPGVDMSSDNVNYKSAIFRGSNPTAFGQSKLYIDGVLVNNVYFDGYSEYLDMPIDLIKRVEVIRGPGSDEPEGVSYAGSIYVITYAEDIDNSDLVFAKIGSNQSRAVGFRKGYKKDDFSLFTDFYYQEDDKKVYTKSDALKSGIFNFKTPFYDIDNSALSYSGDIPLWLKNYSFGLNMNYKDFSFKGRIYEYKQGAAFGFNSVAPKYDDYLKLPNYYIKLQYLKKFDNYKIRSKVGINFNASKSKARYAGEGLMLPKASNPTQTVTFFDGINGELEADQRTLYHGSDIRYDGIKNHQISASYFLSKTDTIKVVSKLTDRNSGVGVVDYTDTLPFFDKDASRETYLFTLGDKYIYSDALQFLSSISYEKNSHIDGVINPKLSLVYHAQKDNIFKILYASSHRTPSWQELYTLNNQARKGNKELEAERIHTFEGAYIKHFSYDSFVQTTLFYLINQNQIHNVTQTNQYINSDKDNKLYGVEIEYKGKFTYRDSIYVNLSYVNGENSYDQTLSQVSKLLFKGYYIYNLKENLTLSTVAKYGSDKNRVSYDSRGKVSGTTVVDSTVNFYNYRDKYRVSLGVKNIFDKDISYISKPYTYEDDYPTVGRSFVLSLRKEF